MWVRPFLSSTAALLALAVFSACNNYPEITLSPQGGGLSHLPSGIPVHREKLERPTEDRARQSPVRPSRYRWSTAVPEAIPAPRIDAETR